MTIFEKKKKHDHHLCFVVEEYHRGSPPKCPLSRCCLPAWADLCKESVVFYLDIVKPVVFLFRHCKMWEGVKPMCKSCKVRKCESFWTVHKVFCLDQWSRNHCWCNGSPMVSVKSAADEKNLPQIWSGDVSSEFGRNGRTRNVAAKNPAPENEKKKTVPDWWKWKEKQWKDRWSREKPLWMVSTSRAQWEKQSATRPRCKMHPVP